MNRKQKMLQIIEHFKNKLPQAETELHYNNEYELAVAVILSAQCTDKRVNIITPFLFEAMPDFLAMSKSFPDEILTFIRSCSYPNNKAKHLWGLAKTIVQDFNGQLPKDVKTLTSLPGIGRKTAHVLLSVLQNESVLAVDTHVFRVSRRLGLVNKKATTPLAVEKQIVRHVPEKNILSKLHHWLILHGRYVCVARNPKCSDCDLQNQCDWFKVNKMK